MVSNLIQRFMSKKQKRYNACNFSRDIKGTERRTERDRTKLLNEITTVMVRYDRTLCCICLELFQHNFHQLHL